MRGLRDLRNLVKGHLIVFRLQRSMREKLGVAEGHHFLLIRGVVVVGDQLIAEVHRLHCIAGAKAATAQDGCKSSPKVCIEGIDDRIEGRVGPPEPDEDVEDSLADTR